MENNELKNPIFNSEEQVIGKKIKPVVTPPPILDIATEDSVVDNIVAAGDSSKIDLAALNEFTRVSQDRNTIYDLIDTMSEDTTVAAALEVYAEDATETNDSGQIIWAESDDANIVSYVNYLLELMNVNKTIYDWVYQLVKYGDCYLKLYRQDELDKNDIFNKNKEKDNTLNEDVIVKANKKNDHYATYMANVPNPADMFELTRFGKTYGYIEAKSDTQAQVKETEVRTGFNKYKYEFRDKDVYIYDPTSFVHATLKDGNNRFPEEVSIFNIDEDDDGKQVEYTYTVHRGQSVLYNVFKTWRELSLLENALLLNRITKSQQIRMYNVEVSDMPKEQVAIHLNKIKNLIEQKSSINVNNKLSEYTNPGAIENNIYVPIHNGVGAITVQDVGGDPNVKGLDDIDFFKDKFFSGLKIPKQFLQCLRGNTPILLLNGQTRTIQHLFENKDEYIGKGIMACDSEGNLVPTTITNIMLTNPSTSFIRIHLDNGQYVDVTPNHQMMKRDGSFVFAADIKEGDSLMPYYDYVKDGRRYVLDNYTGKYRPQYRVVAESVCDIPEKYQVHHKNFIKIDDDFDNLIPMTVEEHYQEHQEMLRQRNREAYKERRENGEIVSAHSGKRVIQNGIEQHWVDPNTPLPIESLMDRMEYIDNYTPECNHKVVSIELINVDEPAYDISVAADCHTFALPCGIFVHNCTDDATGFNGGTSLTILSSRYAKTIKRIQNSISQAILDAVKLILIDKGLSRYIGKFSLKMVEPVTQEHMDRMQNKTQEVQAINDILNIVTGLESKIDLEIAKSLLAGVVENQELINLIDQKIEELGDVNPGGMDDDMSLPSGAGFAGGGMPPMGGGPEEMDEMPGEDNIEGGDEYNTEEETPSNSEQLPNPSELGIDFTNSNQEF